MWLLGLLKHQYVICLLSHTPEPTHNVHMAPIKTFSPPLPAEMSSCCFGSCSFGKALQYSANELFFWMLKKVMEMSLLWKGEEERRRSRADRLESCSAPETTNSHWYLFLNKWQQRDDRLGKSSLSSSCDQKWCFSSHCSPAYLHVGKTMNSSCVRSKGKEKEKKKRKEEDTCFHSALHLKE